MTWEFRVPGTRSSIPAFAAAAYAHAGARVIGIGCLAATVRRHPGPPGDLRGAAAAV
jgi:hypothetical protein